MKDYFKDQPAKPDPFAEDLGKQKDPFAEDLVETIIEDPVDGIAVSEEWKHPETRVGAPIDDAQSARWQEHSYDLADDKEVPYWDNGVCLELARFEAPPGTQGRVSVVETSLLKIPDPGPPTSCACDFPWAYWFMGDIARNPSVRFHLRLDSWRRQGLEALPLVILDTANGLPGRPHPSLGSWNDARYDFGRRNVHVSLFVPEGMYLRLFLEFTAFDIDDDFDRVWGRLAGITQHYRYNPSAEIESRKWPG